MTKKRDGAIDERGFFYPEFNEHLYDESIENAYYYRYHAWGCSWRGSLHKLTKEEMYCSLCEQSDIYLGQFKTVQDFEEYWKWVSHLSYEQTEQLTPRELGDAK